MEDTETLRCKLCRAELHKVERETLKLQTEKQRSEFEKCKPDLKTMKLQEELNILQHISGYIHNVYCRIYVYVFVQNVCL